MALTKTPAGSGLGHTPESLRALREMSQAELARVARVGRSTVARIEEGVVDVQLGKVARVAKVLRVSLPEMVAAMCAVTAGRRTS